jgi:hypothetical protein
MKSQALNIPSKQHFEAYSVVCFSTGMAIYELYEIYEFTASVSSA